MRLPVLAALALAATTALGFSAAPAKADWFDWWYTPRYEGPWCLVANMGAANVVSDCQFRTFDACRRASLTGNRGFCNQNPRYVGAPAATPRPAQAQAPPLTAGECAFTRSARLRNGTPP